KQAYARIFERVGVRAVVVESDPGNMGGDHAHEFQVLVEGGEDRILICENGDYLANADKATRRIEHLRADGAAARPARVSTPGASTIEQLSTFLQEPASRLLKTVLVRLDGKRTAV